VALLQGTTLPERVTLTILKERPDLSLNEVYNNAITVTAILRTRSQREIEQAYREIYFREKLMVRPAPEEGTDHLNQLTWVSPEQWDVSKIPPPKDKEYLVDDWPVVNYSNEFKNSERLGGIGPPQTRIGKTKHDQTSDEI
jgi:hypothetical protein